MLDLRLDDGIAWITLDRPEKRNALSKELWTELPAMLGTLERDPATKVVIFSGRGTNFSAGADITSFANVTTDEDRYAFIRVINHAMESVELFSKPVIAAVHGYAMGGGCELSMMSDIVIADRTAAFGLPEIKVGIMPGPGLVRGLSHVGMHVIKHMVLTGEPLSADEALAAGLVNKVVAEGAHLAEAERIARTMTTRSPIALAEAKKFLNAQVASPFDHVTSTLSFVFGTEAARAGIAAFGKK